MNESEAANPLATPDQRVNQVFTWIVSGHADHEISESIEKLWPGQKPKQLIFAAMKRIAESGQAAELHTVRGYCIEATRVVYQRALEANDLPTALRAIKQLDALAGR